jgi:hypothetical protein
MRLEDLLVPLFFGLIVLFRVVLPWLRKQRSREETVTPEPPEAAAEVEGGTKAEAPSSLRTAPPRLPPIRDRSRDRPPAVAATERPVPSTERRALRSPVGNLRDARRGIVVMTLLGPCRALDRSDSPGM